MSPEFPPRPRFSIDDIKKELRQELFLAKGVEGSKNEESANILRELEGRFSQYSWFFGLALMGSNIRGYGTKTSDVDLKIFYNSSEISNSELTKIIKQYIREIEMLLGLENDHVTIPYFVGFDTRIIQKGVQEVGSRDGFRALLTLKDLSGPVTGEKISGVREKIKAILSKLDTEQRRVVLEKVIDYAVQEEQLGEQKLMQRLGMKEKDMAEFWKIRRDLWVKHVYTLWS